MTTKPINKQETNQQINNPEPLLFQTYSFGNAKWVGNVRKFGLSGSELLGNLNFSTFEFQRKKIDALKAR